MEMVRVQAAEASGRILDLLVAIALRRFKALIRDDARPGVSITDIDFDDAGQLVVYVPGKRSAPYAKWSPSTCWQQGGAILQADAIELTGPQGQREARTSQMVQAPGEARRRYHRQIGDTDLMAAMRCLVSSRLGREVEVPAHLVDCADVNEAEEGAALASRPRG